MRSLDYIDAELSKIEDLEPGPGYMFSLMLSRNNIEFMKDSILELTNKVSKTEISQLKYRLDKVIAKVSIITNNTVEDNVNIAVEYMSIIDLCKLTYFHTVFTKKEAVYFVNNKINERNTERLSYEHIISLYKSVNGLSSLLNKEKEDILINQAFNAFKHNVCDYYKDNIPRGEYCVLKEIMTISSRDYLSKYFRAEFANKLEALRLLYQLKLDE